MDVVLEIDIEKSLAELKVRLILIPFFFGWQNKIFLVQ